MAYVNVAQHASSSGTYEFTALKRVEYGVGSLKRLGGILHDLGAKRAFIITGKSLATKTGVIEKVKNAAGEGGKAEVVRVFHDIGQHAPLDDIRKAVGVLKDENADVIIAVGGGSPIDAGKVVTVEYENASGRRLPLISIPTTLAAAELSIVAGYTNEEGKKITEIKAGFCSSVIIYDALLSLSTPSKLWLSSGIRALDHAIEQQIRPNAPLPILALCREAAATLFASLPACASDPNDLEARQRAFNASWLSLWPDNRIGPLGLSHSLGYNLGSPYSIPHGICSVLTLAPTLRVLASHLEGDDLERLAGVLPFVHHDRAEMAQFRSGRERAEALANLVQELCMKLGLKASLAEYKVPEKDLDGIARRSLASVGRENDRGMQEDIVKALKDMY